jgi:hypothetical protein
MQFNPKIGFVLGILVTIEIAVSTGTLSLSHAVPDAWIPTVIAWSGILAFIGSTVLTFLHGFSSGDVGPLVKAPPVPPATVAKAAAVIVLAALAAGLISSGARAAPASTQKAAPIKPIFPCDPANLLPGCQAQAQSEQNQMTEDLVAQLGKLALPDFQFALGLSKATNNVVSTPCWQAWVDLLSAQQKSQVDANGNPISEPNPHLATDVEHISELLAALRPDSTLSTGCAALAAAGGKDAATLIQGILSGGALGLFKLPVPIGPIP